MGVGSYWPGRPQCFPDLIQSATYYLKLGSTYCGNLVYHQEFHMAQLFKQTIQGIPGKVSFGVIGVCVKHAVDGASAVAQVSCGNS